MAERYRETTARDWLETVVALALFVAVLAAGAVVLIPRYVALWPLLLVGGLLALVRWHAGRYGYRCPDCGHTFTISMWRDLVSPHAPTLRGSGCKLLRCPACVQPRGAERLDQLRGPTRVAARQGNAGGVELPARRVLSGARPIAR